MHKFPYRWNLADGYPAKGIEHHGRKVFGTFICGGGSSMGYKLAGYDHLGGVEIDPKVASVYKANHAPKHLFVEDIRAFNDREDLPSELLDLDLLDGSPPCSSFSTAGSREKAWGKKKKFREGQAKQRLDDLVFEYVRTIGKLQPKVALLENVKGLIKGNAKAYAKRIKSEFEAHGYYVQIFCLNAARMGVPQKRERVFFIGNRIGKKGLRLEFDEKAIPFCELDQSNGPRLTSATELVWSKRKVGDESLQKAMLRHSGKDGRFSVKYAISDKVLKTISAGADSRPLMFDSPHRVSRECIIEAGSYPQDYDFSGIKPQYLIGMSVPPVMTAQIAHQIYLQWLK